MVLVGGHVKRPTVRSWILLSFIEEHLPNYCYITLHLACSSFANGFWASLWWIMCRLWRVCVVSGWFTSVRAGVWDVQFSEPMILCKTTRASFQRSYVRVTRSPEGRKGSKTKETHFWIIKNLLLKWNFADFCGTDEVVKIMTWNQVSVHHKGRRWTWDKCLKVFEQMPRGHPCYLAITLTLYWELKKKGGVPEQKVTEDQRCLFLRNKD